MDCDEDASIFAPHLGRLSKIWIKHPVYFVTTCVVERRPLLTEDAVTECLRREWHETAERHGWLIGPYVVMPDHVHFFAVSTDAAKSLNVMVGRWKEWTAKGILRHLDQPAPLWQHRFFDHVLRSRTSYAEKWDYVRQNPVRAGLVDKAEEWPYAGHIHFDDPR